MEALIAAARAPDYPAEIVGVFANNPSAGGLVTAQAGGIATASASHRDFPDKAGFEAEIGRVLNNWDADLICLAGFMRILSPEFVAGWEGRILNVHPSLLPEFRGLHTHERALEAGVAEHGCTVHFVTPGLDEGPAILQARVPVFAGDTAGTLAARVLVEEHRIFPRALAMVARGEVALPQSK